MTIYDPSTTGRPLNIPEAIAREEGWNETPPALCRRNCTPGNLDFKPWEATHFGAVLETPAPGNAGPGRFARFPDAIAGFAALVHRCGFPDVKGKSLATLIAVWAPPVENNTSTYLRNVCRWTGLTPDTIIDDYLGLP